jgi:hypothetical protein
LAIDTIAPLDSDDEIARLLNRFMSLSQEGKAPVATPEQIEQQSRRSRTGLFAELLDRVTKN